MSNKIIYVLTALALLLAVVGYFIQPTVDQEHSSMVDQMACTMDTLQCPDGTYVARIAPSCEFAACPVATEVNDAITVVNPQPGQVVSGSVFVIGDAIGPWFFEAVLPVEVRDWQGALIEQGFVTALTDWMTVDHVPFSGQISFTSPYAPGDPVEQKVGSLVFKKANPSGEPQFDESYIVPIQFAP